MRGVIRRGRDLALGPALSIDKPDSVTQRRDESAAGAKSETSDSLGHRPRPIRAAGGVEADERRRVDVDPIQRTLVDRPYRTLAETGLDVEHAGKARFHRQGQPSRANKMLIVQEKHAPAATK